MLERLIRIVRRWLSATRKIQQENQKIMTALETLTAQVAATLTVEKSTIVLIQGLADQLRQNANDPAAIFALAQQLKDSQDAVTAAVVANPLPATPPAVVPVTPPVIPPTT